jgi:hypothetical protein
MSYISKISLNNLNSGFKACIAILLLAALTSCVTTDPRLVAALKRTSIREIRIEEAPDIMMVTPFNEHKTDPLLPSVVSTLQSTMQKQLIGLPGGPTRGRLVVTLHVLDVSSKAGRIMLGRGSYIGGTVRLEDAKTGQLIAEASGIRGEDMAMHGEGYGIFIAMAVNAVASAGPDDVLVKRLSDTFTAQVKTWLTKK